MSVVEENVVVSERPRTEPEAVPELHLKLRATRGFAALNLGEVWQFRDLLFTLAGRDIKVRYKQTILGPAWVIVAPLLGALASTFVFGFLAGLPSDGKPYFLFSFAGLMGWNVFNTTLNRVAMCLLNNSNMLSKVYFPRLILPFSNVPCSLLDFGINVVIMWVLMGTAVFMGYHDVVPGLAFFLLPVWVGIMIMLAMGVGLWLAAMMVQYRDVAQILPVGLQMLMFAAPVYYAVSRVPAWLLPYYSLNPLVGVVLGFRWSLLGGEAPTWWMAAWSAAAGAVVLICGAFVFKRMERKFADVI